MTIPRTPEGQWPLVGPVRRSGEAFATVVAVASGAVIVLIVADGQPNPFFQSLFASAPTHFVGSTRRERKLNYKLFLVKPCIDHFVVTPVLRQNEERRVPRRSHAGAQTS